jgi:hypothetical protein
LNAKTNLTMKLPKSFDATLNDLHSNMCNKKLEKMSNIIFGL